MKGFIKTASAVPAVIVGNVGANIDAIAALCRRMESEGVSLAVFPELCLTGYTCADLFHDSTLNEGALSALTELARSTADLKMTFVVGLPFVHDNCLYNVAAVIVGGAVRGLVPKTYIPNYNEFYEKRWWRSGRDVDAEVTLSGGETVRLSTAQLFTVGDARFAVEICEDLWTPLSPGSYAVLAGADIVVNLSASDALIGKYEYIRNLVKGQSGRCVCGYVYASAGFGESSTDLVFDGIALIAENGRLLSSNTRWNNDSHYVTADIDLAAIRHDRMVMSSFADCSMSEARGYLTVSAGDKNPAEKFTGKISSTPFVPESKVGIAARCDEVINIQTAGLAQRLKATGMKNIVVGISGGLDSTLALLVAVKAFDRLGLDRKGIHSVTMPGFGTTGRTYRNAVSLIGELGTSFREISIVPAVTQHFTDIGHDPANHDVTYENSQARQRTLLLMDIANQVNGMVLGTGDLSELAVGWATYNGDHMSMYGVNTGVPKTLVRYLVEHFAEGDADLIGAGENSALRNILRDIVNTPISPELIPADADGNIAQKTEDLVGPYELHDFFLYYMLRYGLSPDMIFERAAYAFAERYDRTEILKWLETFVRRFFSQQFKRSCMPDGPKVGSVCLSPRGDWRMPSDASSALWIERIRQIRVSL